MFLLELPEASFIFYHQLLFDFVHVVVLVVNLSLHGDSLRAVDSSYA